MRAAGASIQAAPAPPGGPAQVHTPPAPTHADRTAQPPTVLEGRASWYGPGFVGDRTASGEAYDPAKLTAAHRTLALGTLVRVTNQRNGRSVVVRINDRGPYVDGRMIDLSLAAADRLAMRTSGVAPVTVQPL
ncbi:MAG TPA: septal ring lytic transglycosylase RlpA family protein [Nitriliruptorales bacterium]|nr:septal ring lytic transglycosylase RlpA family protein [Nitriliruptorales bacterium]